MAVIIPINSNHSGDDPPAEFAILYAVVAVLVWIVVAVAVARHEAADDHRGDGPPPSPDKEQLISGVLVGAGAAFVWPLAIVAGAVWLLVRRLTQPQITPSKEQL
ncbi:hypothetical protein [Streptomyces sp. AMCC400023]|uniref:hypothetical protein n=1 Tax=Streptomyces sp. AMCC400023 TaxID=2056258 RepID=UPI001F1E2080|nr:hypothetical protein [Streptomyces sp. AMCC400023]UJV42075.1 hypothetical protein CVT30_21475 [Streptomyces sp. AMCC400023]